ncbi:RagB/SusD family nutrient uptake outer membrane protein [Membranihabitans marinus]|uniref:RagB/SusD family nutrient uptake outer membrane protein n=1 Tax=Membranihabitans marinus TaxID=1227546 RepID=UPI001F295A5C|nr:RagB/SusD family nutrient uptake outer membrane protein [Membranihabitans marinus]
MKKLILISITIFSLLSCNESLNIAPASQLSNDNFYQSENDFIAAINSAYNTLRSGGLYGDVILFGDIRADIGRPSVSGSVTTRSDIDEFSVNSTNSEIQGTWQDGYSGINQVNNILNLIDEADIDADIKSRIKGEAHFIRGLIYFYLVRLFENIPIVRVPISPAESTTIPQSNANEVYELIESDFELAVQLLPTSYDLEKGRATSIAANGILGKVLLTQNKFQEAKEVLMKVVGFEGQFVELEPNFMDVFDIGNEYNSEIIFAVRWTNDGQNGNGFNYSFRNINQPSLRIEEAFHNSFEVNDIRKAATVDSTSSLIYLLQNKYPEANNGQGESDWPVLRYADVLLMLAEVENELGYQSSGVAFEYLNRIRNRAGLDDLNSNDLPDQNSFRLAVENERLHELACEGHRWFDLVRTNRYVEVLTEKGYSVNDYQKIFPIPQREIDNINDESILKQNPGY